MNNEKLIFLFPVLLNIANEQKFGLQAIIKPLLLVTSQMSSSLHQFLKHTEGAPE